VRIADRNRHGIPLASRRLGGLQGLGSGLGPHGERLPLGRPESVAQLIRARTHGDEPEGACVDRDRTTHLRLARIDGRLHGQLDDALAVETRCQGISHPPDRLLELTALPLDLRDLRLELCGHAVELHAELRELVAAFGRNRLAEVASREPPGRGEELPDLALQGTGDQDGKAQGQHEDGGDQQPAVGDRVRQRAGRLEDRDLERRAGRPVDPRDPAAVVLAGKLEVPRLVGRAEVRRAGRDSRDRRRQPSPALEEARLEPREASDLPCQLARVTDTPSVPTWRPAAMAMGPVAGATPSGRAPRRSGPRRARS
jgi:hypothetical protein